MELLFIRLILADRPMFEEKFRRIFGERESEPCVLITRLFAVWAKLYLSLRESGVDCRLLI